MTDIGTTMYFIVIFSVSFSLVLSEEALCDLRYLGMADGTVNDDQITASSYEIIEKGTHLHPSSARPGNSSYWRPDEDNLDMLQDQWIQIDFKDTVIITTLLTQGSDSSSFRSWIKSLQVQTGNSADSLTCIKNDYSNPQTFPANRNYDRFVRIIFPAPIRTRYLRIIPMQCENNCGLHFEVEGCRCIDTTNSCGIPCQSRDLGMKDDQITASSYHTIQSTSFDPFRARPSINGYWRPDEDTLDTLPDQWIQVDFLDTVIITGIRTQGSDNYYMKSWIRSLQIQTGDSTDTLTFITDINGDPKIFPANTNYFQFVTITLPEPISTRYLRIVPTSCDNLCGLQLEVLGCKLINECLEETDLCGTNAGCYNHDDGYQCTCNPGFTGNGLQCEGLDECFSSPCLHNGTCIDRIDSYSCHCDNGYTGDRCQTDINECVSSPCKYNGTCIDGIDSYSCHCADGFTGNRCQTDTGGPENVGRQSRTNTVTPGVIAGTVIGGFLMIMLALVIIILVKRHKKPSTSSTNPTHDNDSFESDSPPSLTEDTDDVYQEIHERKKEYIHADVVDIGRTQEKPSSEDEEDSIDINATSDDKGDMNEGFVLYASVDKSNKNGGQDNNQEEGWMDNSIYVTTNDDNSQPGTAEAKKGAQDNNREEGWMDNSIYVTTNDDNSQPGTEEATEGWAENSIYGY